MAYHICDGHVQQYSSPECVNSTHARARETEHCNAGANLADAIRSGACRAVRAELLRAVSTCGAGISVILTLD